MNKLTNKRVILITIDALRRDSLKCYGYYRNTAPNLESFINQGTIFLNAYTNGIDSPSSFSAIFSSIFPFLRGGYAPLPTQKKTFQEILKKNNILTYFIHDNPFLGKHYNYDRGFDIFFEGQLSKFSQTRKKLNKNESLKISAFSNIKKIINYQKILEKIKKCLIGFDTIRNWIVFRMYKLIEILIPYITLEYNAPLISRKVINFLKKYNKNMFLCAHFMDVHNPYNPPKRNLLRFRRENINLREKELLNTKFLMNFRRYHINKEILNNLIDLYDGEINFVDKYLLKIFKTIYSLFKKNCLIIITSDHGEAFYEHELLHHTGNIFDEILKIPLIIIELGKKENVKYVEEQVQLIDIAPTILDYFDLEIPKFFQGKSLLPLLKGKSINRDDFIISEGYQKNGEIRINENDGFKLISIRKNNWKYIFDEQSNKEYIFDLKSDPNEKINLSEDNPSILRKFRRFLRKHLQKISDTTEKAKIKEIMHKIEK